MPRRCAEAHERREVIEQVIAVLSQAIADGGRLGGLQVGEAHGRHFGFRLDLFGESMGETFNALNDEVEGLAHAHGIGVVLDIHRGGPKWIIPPPMVHCSA